MELLFMLVGFYAVLNAVVLAIGRGALALLRLAGFRSWLAGMTLSMILAIAILPGVVAGHGVAFVPWILGICLSGSDGIILWALPTSLGRKSHYATQLAKLGGYPARKGDAPPGNTVMWRGLKRLTDIVLGMQLAVETCG